MCECRNGARCNHITGACLCTPGWSGPHCILACPEGGFGENCSRSCECQNGATCDHVSGRCSCGAGWTGASCQEGEWLIGQPTCSAGRYGEDCSQLCLCQHGGFCDRVTGQCSCPRGWTGAACELDCGEGHYGEGCTQTCSCQNGGACDRVTGGCSCPPGWTGEHCQTGVNVTQDGEGPDATNPACLGSTVLPVPSSASVSLGCPATTLLGHVAALLVSLGMAVRRRVHQVCSDFIVARCASVLGTMSSVTLSLEGVPVYLVTTATVVNSGSYGPNCKARCKCSNGGRCDTKTGTCECTPGFLGADCSTWRAVPPCDWEVYLRPRQNRAGLPARGRYGLQCRNTCVCQNGALCEPRDGSCRCGLGWTGPHCETGCPSGFFGQNCARPCDCRARQTCDHVTGRCVCPPGYHGSQCQRREYWMIEEKVEITQSDSHSVCAWKTGQRCEKGLLETAEVPALGFSPSLKRPTGLSHSELRWRPHIPNTPARRLKH
ncbi:unnamed protein product [Coregonus sp. 'balchen']|nr:unnamed protein product [Coregonus sp. 'balchen']